MTMHQNLRSIASYGAEEQHAVAWEVTAMLCLHSNTAF
jgi:hypothetical protein